MSRQASAERNTSLWESWLAHQSVLRALILRELQSRFGRYNIGFLWLIVEPLILASVVTAIHATSHTSFGSSSIRPYPFAVIGYCLVIIFRNNFSRSEGVLHARMSLMYHSQITPLNIMTARVACETTGTLCALAILMGGGILLELADLPVRPLYVFLAIAQITIWSFGLSLVVAAHTHTNHVVGRFVHPISYFMFPLSGAFVTMSALPKWAQEYMAWNPMMGMFETARYGWFETAASEHMYPGYVVAHCALSLYWGLFALRRVRPHLHVA